jgi:hypothetical protein
MSNTTDQTRPNNTDGKAYNAGKATRGIVSEVAEGVVSVWWVVTHPSKSFLRAIGIVGGVAGLTAGIGTVAYLIAGKPGSVTFDWAKPATWGAAAVDYARPAATQGAQIVNQAAQSSGEAKPDPYAADQGN